MEMAAHKSPSLGRTSHLGRHLWTLRAFLCLCVCMCVCACVCVCLCYRAKSLCMRTLSVGCSGGQIPRSSRIISQRESLNIYKEALMEGGIGIWRQRKGNHSLLTWNLLFSSDFLCSPPSPSLSLANTHRRMHTHTHTHTLKSTKNTTPQVLGKSCVVPQTGFLTHGPAPRLLIIDMPAAQRHW